MVSRRGRGCGHDRCCDFEGGRGSFERDRGFYNISEKYWEKFGRLEWAHLADADTPAPSDTVHVHTLSAPHSSSFGSRTVVLSQEYNKLRQFEFS